MALYACGTIVSTHLDFKTFEMRGSLRTVILFAELGWQRVIVQTRDLHLDPPTLNPIIEQEPNQVGHTHVPLGGAGSDEKNEKVLFAESDVPDDQSKLDPGKEEDDAQNGTGKNLKE